VLKFPAELVNRLRPAYQGRVVGVTGGAGFIGGHLVDALLGLGASVRVIDDLSNSGLEHLGPQIELETDRLTFTHGSILDDAALHTALLGCETVFHLAAMGSVPASIEHPTRSFAVNATGTVRVLEAARRVGAQRVIYSASSSAYGEGIPAGATNGVAQSAALAARIESQSPQPLSPYAAGKLAGEHAMSAWARSYGLATISLRYFNVFGPRQPAGSQYAAVIPAFTQSFLQGQRPTIYGDGLQARDFTPVASAVGANLLAGATNRPLTGQVVNIGTGRRTELLELARLIAQRCGRVGVEPIMAPPRAGDVRYSLADISAARALLGYEPIGTLESALDETVAWFRAQYTGV
jgi:nucleoside-diphosphate-sugar epimerase